MTNQNETGNQVPDHYNSFMKTMEDIHNTKGLIKLKESKRKDRKDLATAGLKKFAFDYMPKKYKTGIEAEDLTEEDVQKYTAVGLTLANENSTNRLSGNLESILNAMPKSSFEKLSQSKEIIDKADAKQKVVFDAYTGWKGYEDLERRYVGGEELKDNEKKMINKLAGDGLADEVAKEFSEYSNETQEVLKRLAYHSVEAGHVKDVTSYVLPGIKLSIEEQKSNYEKQKKNYAEITGKAGNVEDMSRDILSKLAGRDAEDKDLETAKDLIYLTSKQDAA